MSRLLWNARFAYAHGGLRLWARFLYGVAKLKT